jgi:hypothetical protein
VVREMLVVGGGEMEGVLVCVLSMHQQLRVW